MRLAIVHLSDIHIKHPQDKILSRAKQIAVGAFRVVAEADAVVVLCTGDIAQSGLPEQYRHAESFFGSIVGQLKAQLSPSKQFLGVVVIARQP